MVDRHSSSEHEHQGHGQHEEHRGMGSRGVSRPMAEMQMHQHHGENVKHGQGHDGGHDQGHGPGHDHVHDSGQRLQMLQMHHKQTLWVYWSLLMLGIWLLAAPFTFGYQNPATWVELAGGRGPWFYAAEQHTALRAALMTWSDVIAGLLLIFFGWRSLTPNRPVSLWACCFIGIYVTFAPLIYWAPSAAAYMNDTVVGILVMALSILIPGMPNMIMYMQHGEPTPPGWSYNPSSWPQRWIMISLGLAGFIVSRYLAAFQLGYIDRVWEPFFGDGSRLVLTSNMSEMWPVSDGGLGALSYTFEFLMGYMGSPARWRTMPWMVAFFGVLVIPLGLTHIILVISQPVVVGQWCTMCLLAAAIMLPMIPLEVDEVVAMCQHMVQAKRRGDRGGSLWQVFWKGGSAEGCTADNRSPELMELPQKPRAVLMASIWGMSVPWTLALTTLLGLWLMFAPWVLGVGKPASHIDHLGGALIVTVSVICMGEVVRAGRFLNILLALIVGIAPWFLTGGTTGSRVNDVLVALAVIAVTLPRGKKTEKYGLWDPRVF